MLSGLCRRVLIFVLLVWAVYSSVFLVLAGAIRLNPARVFSGPIASQQDVEELRHRWGLDKSIAQRYFIQMGLLARGSLGRSLFYRRPTTDLVRQTLPASLTAIAVASLSALFLAFPLSIAVSAGRRRPCARHTESALLFLQSLPGFVYLFLTLWVASRFLGLSPWRAPVFYWFMAVVCATVYPLAATSLYLVERLRASSHTMSHVNYARALGLPSWRISLRLAKELFPAAMTLTVSLLGAVFTTVFFAEFIFALNGCGALLLRSAMRGDTPVVMGGVLVASFLFLGTQLLSDIFHRLLDPRVRNVGMTDDV